MSMYGKNPRPIDPDEEGSVLPETELSQQAERLQEREQQKEQVSTPSTSGAPRTPVKGAVCEDVFCDMMTVEPTHMSPPSQSIQTPVFNITEKVNASGVEGAIRREGRQPDPIPMPAKERERKVAAGEEDI